MHDHDHIPIEIRIDSDPQFLCVVRSAVEKAAATFGLPQSDCDRLVLAVDEALTNIIRHGYGGRSDQPIWITLSPVHNNGAPGVEVVIDDETRDVDLQSIKARSLDQVRPGGLGVSIIQQSVDECAYQCRADSQGIRLTLRKFASSSN
jgi:anti-sigma regulatory factor (Ser/Thr protein kinase)